MSDQQTSERVHVVIGTPWKDAVIKFLEPSSPYAPWPLVPDARSGDGVVVVFDGEPRSVVTDVGRVGADSDVDAATAVMSDTSRGAAVPVSRIGGALESAGAQHILLDGAAATDLLSALDDHRFRADEGDRFGRTSMAEAAVLHDSHGVCAGCDEALGLGGADARDTVRIWMIETLEFRPEPKAAAQPAEPNADDIDSWFGSPRAPRIPIDWPAALCARCMPPCATTGSSRSSTTDFHVTPCVHDVAANRRNVRFSAYCRSMSACRRGGMRGVAASLTTSGRARCA